MENKEENLNQNDAAGQEESVDPTSLATDGPISQSDLNGGEDLSETGTDNDDDDLLGDDEDLIADDDDDLLSDDDDDLVGDDDDLDITPDDDEATNVDEDDIETLDGDEVDDDGTLS